MVEDAERNLAIMDSFSKAESVVAKYRPEEIAVSISGGSDSDIMMDLMLRQEGGRRFHEGGSIMYSLIPGWNSRQRNGI